MGEQGVELTTRLMWPSVLSPLTISTAATVNIGENLYSWADFDYTKLKFTKNNGLNSG